ncbi:MAG: 30S ribosomal protein S5 [Patescibacteria group bacterium]|nr:30S ribosomal protein S5 [Patescibacteria group bacterium]MDE2437824.1 30S ribosomal protein S5 [Patescibacteria group bacterium]
MHYSNKQQDKYESTTIDLRRVTRVVAGGKRMSFRATVVVGTRMGEVGLGIGKGLDVAQALDKAKTNAKKNVMIVPIKDKRTIPHEVEGHFGAAHIMIKPAAKGRGVIAGSSVRSVLTLAGYVDISAKILSSTKNKLNNAQAVFVALQSLARKTS